MGFNPWNAFHEFFTEKDAFETIDYLVSSGLVEAGYTYFNLDDGWMMPRDGDSALQPNLTMYPSGIKGIADYAHSKGLKVGIYSSAGTNTCKGFPASLGYEDQDAKMWAEWGVDLVKYDNCYSAASDKSIKERYEAMRDAILASGRPMVFAVCEWGLSEPWVYGQSVGHMWRTTKDISLDIAATWPGILENLDSTARLARYAGPGGWNDADMLEVGPPGNAKLTLAEQRAHFALWAVIKSPLIIGADLKLLKPSELKILKAKEVIAINQDPLGVAGDLVWKQGPEEVWAAPLQGGGRAVVLFNRQMAAEGVTSRELTVHWHQIGYEPGIQVKVRDLYKGKDLGEFTGHFKGTVINHGALILRLTPTEAHESHERWRPWPCSSDPSHGSQGAYACPSNALMQRSESVLKQADVPSSTYGFAGYILTSVGGVFLGLMVGLSPLRGVLGRWVRGRQYRELHSPHALALSDRV
ncbi:hypothetical protein WJX73_000379 [Symbiochloris irregularis]|uniref:Alpha-galactosidase n=1 Tax=Symbiochloris irregularis TaxID=706552 RepID=A0AAW1PUW3_9CHLO